MFFPNDVIEYDETPVRALRILWIDGAGMQAYVYPLRRPSALPQPLALSTLADDVARRRARLLLQDPYRAAPRLAAPDKQRQLQARAWQAVSALHARLPGHGFSDRGGIDPRVIDPATVAENPSLVDAPSGINGRYCCARGSVEFCAVGAVGLYSKKSTIAL